MKLRKIVVKFVDPIEFSNVQATVEALRGIGSFKTTSFEDGSMTMTTRRGCFIDRRTVLQGVLYVADSNHIPVIIRASGVLSVDGKTIPQFQDAVAESTRKICTGTHR